MIHILRELANKAKLLNFNLIKCLLEKNNSLSEILFIGESQDDWVQTEIMPTHEYEENGAHIIHTTAHVRNGVNDIFCEFFF